jgi:hypothetical protein
MQAREFVQQKPITLLGLKSLLDLFPYDGAVEASGSDTLKRERHSSTLPRKLCPKFG